MFSFFFFGTEEFGAAILESLIKNGNFKVKKVFTQPDRPVGRKQELQKSPVKLIAEKYGLEVAQPGTLKNFELSEPAPDLNVVCQYGLIIPKKILEYPKKGSINVHTSLLPKYRGASPIQTAIINGETETGVTIMVMDEKMDHGDILAQAKVEISPDETYLELSKKMEPIACELLIPTLDKWLKKEIAPQTQDESQATFCKLFTREDGKVNWNKSAQEIYNQYRGLTPWPGIWATLQGKRLKLITIRPGKKTGLAPGQIVFEKDAINIGTSDGSIEALELQLEGSKQMNANAFSNGFRKFQNLILE